nr:hypothetical protein [Tanacetum cinerariifolium]
MVPAAVLTQSKPVPITAVRPVSTVVPNIKGSPIKSALSSRLKTRHLTMMRSLQKDVGISSGIDPRVPT